MLAVDSEVERITEVTAWARGETKTRTEPERR
jgi:endonuclease III